MMHTELHGLYKQTMSGTITPILSLNELATVHDTIAKQFRQRDMRHIMPIDELDNTVQMSPETEAAMDAEKDGVGESLMNQLQSVKNIQIREDGLFIPFPKSQETSKDVAKGIELKDIKPLDSVKKYPKDDVALQAMSEDLFKLQDEFFVEQKYDGIRTIIQKHNHKAKIQKSSKYNLSTSNMEELLGDIKNLSANDFALDGCLVAIRDGKHVSPTELGAEDTEAAFYVFDIPYYDGKSMHDTPLYERKKILTSLGLSQSPSIRAIPSLLIKTPTDLLKAVNIVSKTPFSVGAVVKDSMSTYPVDGVSDKWIYIADERKTEG